MITLPRHRQVQRVRAALLVLVHVEITVLQGRKRRDLKRLRLRRHHHVPRLPLRRVLLPVMLRLRHTLTRPERDRPAVVIGIRPKTGHPVHVPCPVARQNPAVLRFHAVQTGPAKIHRVIAPVHRHLKTVHVARGTPRKLRLHSRERITARDARSQVLCDELVRAKRRPERVHIEPFDTLPGPLLRVTPQTLYPESRPMEHIARGQPARGETIPRETKTLAHTPQKLTHHRLAPKNTPAAHVRTHRLKSILISLIGHRAELIQDIVHIAARIGNAPQNIPDSRGIP
ncbi:MAG: hypothetical protein BWY06_03056 [Candidatus Latescibacteria bacterium ADurb.Bin168]|nr:MAG: hypothetical protein BWY06_03056 [Candidatus Latescibacteria bacterium ADurb.Bin168]